MITTDHSKRDATWPRSSRLRRPQEFRVVYQRGSRKTSRSFVVFVLPNDSPADRFGLTTSRRLGKAHERNRVRRRVRELLRRGRSVPPRGGADIVINPRRSVLDRSFRDLGAELRDVLGEWS